MHIWWQHLRQPQEQLIQEYTVEFQKLAIIMNISKDETSILIKYIESLHSYIQQELALFRVHSLDEALQKSNVR